MLPLSRNIRDDHQEDHHDQPSAKGYKELLSAPEATAQCTCSRQSFPDVLLALASLLPLWLGWLALKRWLSAWRRSWQGGSEDHHARNRSQLAREKKLRPPIRQGLGWYGKSKPTLSVPVPGWLVRITASVRTPLKTKTVFLARKFYIYFFFSCEFVIPVWLGTAS